MKLYSGPVSLFTAKVRVALAEKGIAYERVEVGWSLESRYAPHHPDVVALNPKRQVPILVDDDLVVYDSTLILEYLEERFPEPPLFPRDLRGRAECRQLEAAADEIVFPLVWELVEEVLYPAGAQGRSPERLHRAKQGLDAQHEGLDKCLAGRAYLCGEFGVADIAMFIMLACAATLGAPPDPRHAHVADWLARTGARTPIKTEMAEMSAFVARMREGA